MELPGWIAYYEKHSKWSLRNTLLLIDSKLVKWLGKKHKAGNRKTVAKLQR
ncbi:group II intron maturase-specific domain-containing protein [Candidatus Scalindua japonica]|uniref:group II intron maturase-specific domain-containing protein n=1 Tax=Candidatus Scalindua japonica TaxID=1284222 RepID=UPI000BDF3EDC|nr:group II intron maturase-specific domain-containing protein [Candidatus Scalindua japonica]